MEKIFNSAWGLILIGVVFGILFMALRAGEYQLWGISEIAGLCACWGTEFLNTLCYDKAFSWKRVGIMAAALTVTVGLLLV